MHLTSQVAQEIVGEEGETPLLLEDHSENGCCFLKLFLESGRESVVSGDHRDRYHLHFVFRAGPPPSLYFSNCSDAIPRLCVRISLNDQNLLAPALSFGRSCVKMGKTRKWCSKDSQQRYRVIEAVSL